MEVTEIRATPVDRKTDWEGLARAYGTPFYFYDANIVKARIEHVRRCCADLVSVYYAVKANPNLALLRAVRATADGLDISSAGELQQALLAGYDPMHLSFAGPAKTASELTAAIEAGVGCISAESPRELDECVRIAKRLGVRANVALRINPALLNRAFGIKMGGRSVQFGIDEEEIAGAAELVRTNREALNFRGVHVYAGSQCFEAEGVVEGVANTFRLVREVERAVGLDCAVVNLGGGFGVAAGADARELDLVATGAALQPIIRQFVGESRVKREIVFELGRYLTAAAGVYVARVVGCKPSRGKMFFVTDGGLHHHLAAAGTFGAALRANFAIKNLSRSSAAIRCNIAGPSCNPTDLLGVDVELARPEEGDLVAILGSGSYGFTASPVLFLGRPTAAELVRDGDEVTLGRRSRTMTDFN